MSKDLKTKKKNSLLQSMSIRYLIGMSIAGLLFVGCSTPQITNTKRGIVEELLLSTAIERGVNQFPLSLYRGKKFAMDYANLAPDTDKAYLIGMMEMHLANNGIIITADPKEAEFVMQVYCGVLATDDNQILVGTPPLPIPLPDTTISLQIPELALFKKLKRRAMCRLAVNILNAKDRMPIQSISGVNSLSEFINWTVLFFPFTSHTLPIQEVDEGESDYAFFE